MKITLIEPSLYGRGGKLLRSRRIILPSLTLPYLAAFVPSPFPVRIIHEYLEDIDFNQDTDLVGITSYTSHIRRAYEIADEFRRRGKAVVMGGIHVSMVPEEALEHADTVIVGEAEETWPAFLEDFQKGCPRRRYIAPGPPSLKGLPVPKFSLLDASRYQSLRPRKLRGLLRLPVPMFPVQTARGCPHDCTFCSVTKFSGRSYRARPIGEVIEEIQALKARSVFFCDDNIFAHPERARELMDALEPLKILWIAQATVNAARDRSLLRQARKSGCVTLFIGLESLSQEALSSVNKGWNKAGEYETLLRTFREEGISVFLSMIFGLDGESPRAFEETYDFLMRNRIPYSFWFPLMPFPGTDLFKNLKESGRLKAEKWWLNLDLSGKPVLKFHSPGRDEEDFFRRFKEFYQRFYSIPSILFRVLCPPRGRSINKLVMNFALREDFPNLFIY